MFFEQLLTLTDAKLPGRRSLVEISHVSGKGKCDYPQTTQTFTATKTSTRNTASQGGI